jgi:hypothetical protein
MGYFEFCTNLCYSVQGLEILHSDNPLKYSRLFKGNILEKVEITTEQQRVIFWCVDYS